MNKRFAKQTTLKDQLPKRAQPAQGSSVGVPKSGSLPEFGQDRPNELAQRLAYLRDNANFLHQQLHVRDGVKLHVFVRHQGFDQFGNELPNDGSAFPGERQKKANEDTRVYASTAFDRRGEVHDPAAMSSSDSEDSEKINYDDDAEQEAKVHQHRFTIDLVARYADETDDLILHWGMSRKREGAWGTPDQAFHPVGTRSFNDGLACQTTFQREPENPSIVTVTIVLNWTEEVDPPVTSISYVLTERDKKIWHQPEGRDQVLVFCPNPEAAAEMGGSGEYEGVPRGKIGEAVTHILNAECKSSSWTLMHRYHRVRDILTSGNLDMSNRDHVVYIYIWLRYSFTKQLTWQKSYNTKPKDLQHAQVVLTNEICEQYKHQSGKPSEQFLSSGDLIRLMTCFIGKGSGNGQEVRDEILHIMHRNKISERAGHFYEQWHQKLHNNTTPDDIPICEALLAYLKSGGNMSEYWRVLTENGITRERLASYERKITEEPWYKPEAIRDFENYLAILKRMHSSDDMNLLIGEAWGHVGGDTHNLMQDLQRGFGDHDVLRQMERAYSLRANLCYHHYDKGNTQKLKDVMFLDLCLEGYIRALTEKIMHIDIGFEAYVREMLLILKSLCLSYQWTELNYLRDDWKDLVLPLSRDLNQDNARKVKSVIDRIKMALGEVNDVFENVMQSKAEMMGNAFRAQEYSVKLFSEEVLRGTLFFSLSMILKKIDPIVRKCANLGDWLIISQGRAHGSRGYVEIVPKLYDVMHNTYDRRSVLLVDKITGEEEVPSNVQAMILMNSSDYPDVLAHVSVRARNLKVLFAVCFDEAQCRDLKALAGKHLILNVKGQSVDIQEQNPQLPLARRASSHLILQSAIDTAAALEPPPMFTNSLMYMDEFSRKHSGAKSNNLKILRGKLDHWIKLPESAVLPFQLAEYSTSLEPSTESKLMKLIEKIHSIKSVKKMTKMLHQCKELVLGLKFYEGNAHHRFLKEQLLKFGIPAAQFDQAWYTIKRVWASKFNERAFLATKKLGVRIDQIFMAVLVQKVIPAEYAYVIHTTNPMNLQDDEVYVESCIGLGEALVSDMPGQAFSFAYNKRTKQSTVGHYPNKSLGLTATGFIFRSDSNSEDLAGFAGAGLFDSYTMNEEQKFRINYNQEKLILNEPFRNQFMQKLGQIGAHIEQIYDEEPQDIEGTFYNGEYYVVQTRPQV